MIPASTVLQVEPGNCINTSTRGGGGLLLCSRMPRGLRLSFVSKPLLDEMTQVGVGTGRQVDLRTPSCGIRPCWPCRTCLGRAQWGSLNPHKVKSPVLNNYLPEPGALKNNEAGSEKLQHNIVPEDHLHEDTEGPSKHRAQQERVDVLVQGRSVMHVVVEEETCTKQFQPSRARCFLHGFRSRMPYTCLKARFFSS